MHFAGALSIIKRSILWVLNHYRKNNSLYLEMSVLNTNDIYVYSFSFFVFPLLFIHCAACRRVLVGHRTQCSYLFISNRFSSWLAINVVKWGQELFYPSLVTHFGWQIREVILIDGFILFYPMHWLDTQQPNIDTVSSIFLR